MILLFRRKYDKYWEIAAAKNDASKRFAWSGPIRVQPGAGLLQLLFGPLLHSVCGMKPGIPVVTTLLSLSLVWTRLISLSASSGSAVMSKFPRARAPVLGVVSKAVARCTAHASKTPVPASFQLVWQLPK